MPQLDFSFYISQITWLLVSFFSFFCVSKFLILPQLDRILNKRTNLIKTNTDFAKEKLEEAKIINDKCEEKIKATQSNINNEINALLKQLAERNQKKINDLKKRLLDAENKNLLTIKNELREVEDQLKEEIVNVAVDILNKVYIVKADKKEISKLFDKLYL